MHYIDTVRCLVVYQNKVLLLKKSLYSNIPGAYEFPGGKVEEEQACVQAAKNELLEETGIAIDTEELEKINYFKQYSFTLNKTEISRNVYYFLVHLDKPHLIEIDRLKDENGNSEDKHDTFKWFTYGEIHELIEFTSKNKNKTLNTLSPNSRIDISILEMLLH